VDSQAIIIGININNTLILSYRVEEPPPKVTVKLKVSSSTNTTEHLVKKPVDTKKTLTTSEFTSKPSVKHKKEEPEVTVVLKAKPKDDIPKEESTKKVSCRQKVQKISSIHCSRVCRVPTKTGQGTFFLAKMDL